MNKFPLQKINNIVRHAFMNSDFYRQLYKKEPNIKNYDDFQILPIITRNCLREHFDEFLCNPNSKSLRFYTTSGTTGVHKIVAYNTEDVQAIQKNAVEAMRMVGVKRDSALISIFSYGPTPGGREILETWEMMGMKGVPVSIYTPELAIPLIKRFKVEVIFGLPSSLLKLGHLYKGTSVKKLITAGELLTPMVREKLETLWNSEVYNMYASLEGDVMGIECYKHSGIHTFDKTHFIEVIDSKGMPTEEGEKGRIILTHLKRKTVPLIRYELGDYVIKLNDRCSCGLDTLKIEPVGRSDEAIIAGGAIIFPVEYSEALYACFSTPVKFMIKVSKNEQGLDEIFLDVLADQSCSASKIKEHFVKNLSRISPDFGFAIKEGLINKVEVTIRKIEPKNAFSRKMTFMR